MALFRRNREKDDEQGRNPAAVIKPDLSRVNVMPVNAADLKQQRDNIAKSREAFEERQDEIKEHPLYGMPDHMRDDVMKVLEALMPGQTEGDKRPGVTKSEARDVLSAAMDMLDTKYAPEFAVETDQTRIADEAKRKAERENFMGHRPNPEGPRVMDTMSHMAIGKAMFDAMMDGNYDEIMAALKAPVSNSPDIVQAAAEKNAPSERPLNTDNYDTAFAARVAEIEAEQAAKTNKDANAKDGKKR